MGYVPEKYLPAVPDEDNEVGGEEAKADDALSTLTPPSPSEPGTAAAAATIAVPVASSLSLAARTNTNPLVPTEEYTPSPTPSPMVGKEASSTAAFETHYGADSSGNETTAAVTPAARETTTITRAPSRQFSLDLMDMDTVMDVEMDMDMDDSDDNDDENDDENANTTYADNEDDTDNHDVDINGGVNDDGMI